MTARWLTPAFAARLDEIDAQFGAERHDGPLAIEIHYRGGAPRSARVREYLLPPALIEVSIHASTS